MTLTKEEKKILKEFDEFYSENYIKKQLVHLNFDYNSAVIVYDVLESKINDTAYLKQNITDLCKNFKKNKVRFLHIQNEDNKRREFPLEIPFLNKIDLKLLWGLSLCGDYDNILSKKFLHLFQLRYACNKNIIDFSLLPHLVNLCLFNYDSSTIRNLPSKIKLELGYSNHIQDIIPTDEIGNLTIYNVKKLDLSASKNKTCEELVLHSISDITLSDSFPYETIKYLELDHCNLAFLKKDAFEKMTSLKYCNINSCYNLKSIKGIGRLDWFGLFKTKLEDNDISSLLNCKSAGITDNKSFNLKDKELNKNFDYEPKHLWTLSGKILSKSIFYD